MAKKYSDSMLRLRELIKLDYKRRESKKIKQQRQELLEWYVYNCPSSEGPEKAKKFKDYGIVYGCHFSGLKDRIIKGLRLKDKDTYLFCESGDQMEKLISDIETRYVQRRKPIIFFSKGSNAELDSLYIRIRNSFAHGNYFISKEYYCLWNETGSSGSTKKLGSFMMLKYDHLKLIYEALGYLE